MYIYLKKKYLVGKTVEVKPRLAGLHSVAGVKRDRGEDMMKLKLMSRFRSAPANKKTFDVKRWEIF